MGAESLIDNGNATMGATPSMVPTGLYYSAAASSNLGGSGLIKIGGTVTVEVYAPSTATTPIQTLQFAFQQGGALSSSALWYPLPNLYISGSSGNTWCGTYRTGNNQSPVPYSTNGATGSTPVIGTFKYPNIWMGTAGASQANRNTGYRIGGNSYYWLGGGVSGGTTT